MKNSNQLIKIETDDKIVEYSQVESFKITNHNEVLLKKISILKNDLPNKQINDKYDNCKIITSLVTIDDQFNYVQFIYDEKQKLQNIQKQISMNRSIIELSKKVILTTLYIDKLKQITYIIVCTDRKLIMQDVDDNKNIKVLFELGDSYGCITNVFEGLSEKSSNILLVLNDCVIFELDINRNEFISEGIVSNFVFKNKTEAKNKKNFKLEYEGYSYSVFHNYDESSNPKNIWKFNEKIITLKFRTKQHIQELRSEGLYKGNHLAISFDCGRLKLFHYESKALVSEYKTHFGNIISIGFSLDGKVMGLGTESDNVFVIDAEFNQLLFCLEGHRNYVTSVIFSEQVYSDDEGIGYFSNYDTNNSDKNTVLQSKNSIINRELTLEDFTNIILKDDENVLDIKQLRRHRTSTKPSIIALPEYKNSITYDIYTSSLDGYIGIWRIEYFYNQGVKNDKNYISYPINKDSNQIVKLEIPGTIELNPNNEIRVFYSDMVKILNSPIHEIHLIDNILVYIAKRNNIGSSVYLRFYHGIVKNEEVDNNDRRIRHNSLKNKIEKRNSSVSPSPMKKVSTSETNDSIQTVSYFNTPKISRGKSVQKIKN